MKVVICDKVIFFLYLVLKHFCLCSSQAGRTEGVCDELIDSDARSLYEAGEGRKGKDCSMFIEILATRSFSHLRQGLLHPCSVEHISIFILFFSYTDSLVFTQCLIDTPSTAK